MNDSKADDFYKSDYYKLETLQSQINKYLITKKQSDVDMILEKISLYIKNYSEFVFNNFEEDFSSDFYLHFVENFDYVLKLYDPEKGKFKNYLSHVLYNMWINFYKKKKKGIQTLSNFETQYFEQIIIEKAEDEKYLSKEQWSIQELFKQEDPLKYIILKLFYHEFFNDDDILLLADVSQKSYGSCLVFFQQLLTEIAEKKRKKSAYEMQLTKVHFHLSSLKPKSKEQREKLLKQYDKYLKFYNRAKVYPSYETIALFLNLSPSKVANIINYFKEKTRESENIRKYMED